MNLLPMAAVASALALGGCASVPSLLSADTGARAGDAAAPAAPAPATDAEKALAIAHLAYQAAGIALEQAAQSGALRGGNAATAQALYDEAGAALALADAANAATDAQGTLAKVATVEALVAQITTLIPK
jgi:hypothetical protein